MGGNPLVCVITIFLDDEEQFLAEAIASVLAQSVQDWERLEAIDARHSSPADPTTMHERSDYAS